jgi:hypothetical protein
MIDRRARKSLSLGNTYDDQQADRLHFHYLLRLDDAALRVVLAGSAFRRSLLLAFMASRLGRYAANISFYFPSFCVPIRAENIACKGVAISGPESL